MADRKPKTQTQAVPIPQEAPKRKETREARYSRFARMLAHALPDGNPLKEQLLNLSNQIATGQVKLNPSKGGFSSLIGATIQTPYGKGQVVKAQGGFYEVHLINPPAQGPKVVFLSRKIQKA